MENIKNISKALCQAQSEMSNAKKGTANNFFKSKYADLNAIREAVIPILNAHGITVLQPIVHVDGKNFIKTILLHETGESLDSHIEIIYSKQNDAQSQGSGITYARRYALQSFVCVGAEDDDGNIASQKGALPPISMERFKKALQAIAEGTAKKEDLNKFTLTEEQKNILKNG